MFITNFELEDFLKTSHEPYLSFRPSTNLLNTMLPDELTRQQTCKSFIESLKTHGKKIIKTEFHLNWAMECLGYSFSLQTTEIQTISTALNIYKDWFSLNPGTPEVFKQNFSQYQREILGHISLVFVKKDNLSRQEKICVEVLAFIKSIIKLQLSQETWESLLYMLIISFDHLIKKFLKLAETLSGSVLKVLFEAWIRAKCYKVDLWSTLKKKVSLWIDCKSTISHWASVTLSLTKTVTSLIYCENSKEIEIVFDPGSSLSEIIRIPLTEEEKVYFWYRFTQLIIDETKSSAKMNPEIHSALSGSVSSILNYFLSICSRQVVSVPIQIQPMYPSSVSQFLQKILSEFSAVQEKYIQGKCRLPIPSINSLMALFGNWLFYHAQIDPAYDSFGKSETLSILCKIFSFAQGPANPEYSTTFFTVLLSNICDGDKYVVGEILKNSTEIVKYGIEAIDFLLRPDGFIQHLAIYLCDKETENSIRYPCYLILATISVIPNVYKIKQISRNIVDIFVCALGIEEKKRNFNLLVWSMCAFMAALVDDQDSIQRIICTMVDRLEKIEYKDKDISKFADLLEVLTILPYLIDKRLVAAQIIKRNVEKFLCILPKRGKSIDDFQTTGVLLAIHSWVTCFPVALTNPEIRFEVIKCLENRKKQYKSLVMYIQGCLFNTLQSLFRNESGTNLSNTLKKSISEESRKHFRYFDSLWSFYQKDSSTGVVCRNASGLYSWKIRLILEADKQKVNLKLPIYSIFREKIQEKNEIIEAQLEAELTNNEKKFFQKLKVLYCFQKNRSSQLLPQKSLKKNEEIQKSDWQSADRMLIAQLGLLDKDCRKDLIPILPKNFISISNVLDSLGEKESIAFPIIYLENPEDTEKNIFSKDKIYSKGFNIFIQSLGMILKPSTNFTHFLHFIKNFDKIVYKNFNFFESFVYFPEFLKQDINIGLKEFICEHLVVVIWNQNMNDSYSKKIPNILADDEFTNRTVIVLNVINERLTRINIRGNAAKKGPLVNQMVVPNELLGKLLNFTVYCYKNCQKTRDLVWQRREEVLKHLDPEVVKYGDLLYSLFN